MKLLKNSNNLFRELIVSAGLEKEIIGSGSDFSFQYYSNDLFKLVKTGQMKGVRPLVTLSYKTTITKYFEANPEDRIFETSKIIKSAPQEIFKPKSVDIDRNFAEKIKQIKLQEIQAPIFGSNQLFLEKIGKTDEFQYIDSNCKSKNVFGLELEDKKRIWFTAGLSNVQNELKTNPVTIHEVINSSCKYFCDIDDKENKYTRKEFMKVIAKTCLFFKSYFEEFYNLHKLIVNPAISISNGPYNSAHIIFNISCFDGANIHKNVMSRPEEFFCDTPPNTIFERPTIYSITAESAHSQLYFWKNYTEFLKSFGVEKDIDLLVYRKNAQLRVINSPKNGQILVPIYLDYKTMRYTAPNGLLGSEIEIIDERQNIYDHAVSLDGTIRILKRKELYRKKYYTRYEELEMLDILKKSSINIDRRFMWVSAVTRIYHFFHMLTHFKRVQLVVNFCAKKGWNTDRDITENEELCNSFYEKKSEYGYGIKSMRDFFKPYTYSPEIINVDKITYPSPNEKFGILCIKSGAGTCKTLNFVQNYKNKKVLYISYRKTLAEEIRSKGVEIASYLDYKINEKGEPPQHLVVQLESLYKFHSFIEYYDFIFCDESEELIAQFNHCYEKWPKTFSTLQDTFRKIMDKNVVFCSANLGQQTLNFIESFGKPFHYIENQKKDKEGYICHQYNSEKDFFDKIVDLASKGKKLIIATNSLRKSVKIGVKLNENMIQEYEDEIVSKLENKLVKYGKVLTQSGGTPELVPPKEWVNYDFVIYTPVIEAGVSFEESHFDHICGYYLKKINSYTSCYQSLFRCRAPKSKEMFVYMERGCQLLSTDYYTEREVAVEMEVKAGKREDFDITYTEPLKLAILRNRLLLSHNKYRFGLLLQDELANSGVEIKPVISQDFLVEKNIQFDNFIKTSVHLKEKYGENFNASRINDLVFKLNAMNVDIENFECVEDRKDDILKRVETTFIYKDMEHVIEIKKLGGSVPNVQKDIISDLIINFKDSEEFVDNFAKKNWQILNTIIAGKGLNHFLNLKYGFKIMALSAKLSKFGYELANTGTKRVKKYEIVRPFERFLENKKKAPSNEEPI